MKKIFIAVLTFVFTFGLISPVLAVGETEALFENGNAAPLFSEANFLPGQTVTRWVKFKNNTADSLTAATKISSYTDSNGLGNWLDVEIKEGAVILFNKTLKEFYAAGEVMLSEVAGNGAQTQYDFSITMKPETGNVLQGKTLSFDIQVGVGSEEAVAGETPSGKSTGGGGYNYSQLIIFNENAPEYELGATNILITWTTNQPATSRVIYDRVSHPNIAGSLPPNYSYAFSTTEDSNKVTGHAVLIGGLTPDTIYYFRAVSQASPEKYGREFSVATLALAKMPENETNFFIEPLNENQASRGQSSTAAPAATESADSILGATVEQPELFNDSVNQTRAVAGATDNACRGPRIWLIALLIIIYSSGALIIQQRFKNRSTKRRWLLFILTLSAGLIIFFLPSC